MNASTNLLIKLNIWVICGSNCTKDKTRSYLKVDTTKDYPNI